MPRNKNGQYFLPDGNPVISGELITAQWANTTLDDIAEALTESLDRSGAGGMTAPLRVVDGTAAIPGVAFATETGTGLYKPSNGAVGIAVGGKSVVEFNGNGVNVPGVVNGGSLGGAAAGGAGASGKWKIDISGKADTAGRADTAAYADEAENSHRANGLNAHQGDWTNWDAANNVVGMLGWKNYGNGHVIFDASSGVTPSGTGVDNVNPTQSWAATYPTLMGWNGQQTYGVRVDSARTADTAAIASNYAERVWSANYGAMRFNWMGQGGQPNWLWGGNDADPSNMYVYNPANFTVNAANRVINTAGAQMQFSWYNPQSVPSYLWVSNAPGEAFLIDWGTMCANAGNYIASLGHYWGARQTFAGGCIFAQSYNMGEYESMYLADGRIQFAYASIPVMSVDSIGDLRMYGWTAFKKGGGVWADSSDARLKRNVKTLTTCLDTIMKLNPVEFEWAEGYRGGAPQVGFVADQVEKVLPNAVVEYTPTVTTDGATGEIVKDDDYVMVQMLGEDAKVKCIGFQNDIFAYLVGAIQELKAEVDSLQAKVTKLEAGK